MQNASGLCFCGHPIIQLKGNGIVLKSNKNLRLEIERIPRLGIKEHYF